MTNIVIGIDGSETSAHALRWATREGHLHHQQVTAVLAWGLLNQSHADRSDSFDPDYGTEDAWSTLRAYVCDAIGIDRVDEVDLRPINDLPWRALIDASREASMLVLGGRGLGGFRGMVLGTVSYHCLHRAACPIAIIRDAAPAVHPEGTESVVVGIDGSEASQQALTWAVQEATARGASLEIVHAWHAQYAGTGMYGVAPIDPKLFEVPAQRMLDGCLDGIDVSGLVQPPKRTLVCDSAAHALLTAAKDADLLVTGSRGVGGFAGLLVGSTTSQVVHHADCPVVVIPTGR